MEKKTKNNRIKSVRTLLNKTQKEFAESLNVTVSYISDLENGRREVSDMIIFKLEKLHFINPEWMRTGEGNIYTIDFESYLGNNHLSQNQISKASVDKNIKPTNYNNTIHLSAFHKHTIVQKAILKDLPDCFGFDLSLLNIGFYVGFIKEIINLQEFKIIALGDVSNEVSSNIQDTLKIYEEYCYAYKHIKKLEFEIGSLLINFLKDIQKLGIDDNLSNKVFEIYKLLSELNLINNQDL